MPNQNLTYICFNVGDEVTAIRKRGSTAPTFNHLIVTQLKSRNRMVVLSDGSRWTQSGDTWGKRNTDQLLPRKNGLVREATAKAERDTLVLRAAIFRQLDRLKPALVRADSDNADALVAAREIVKLLEGK